MEFVEHVARLAGSIAAIIAALGVLLHPRSPFGRVARWFARRNIGDPVSHWARGQVLQAMAPSINRLDELIQLNHDAVIDLSVRNDAQHAETDARLASVEAVLLRDPDSRTRVDDPNESPFPI